MFSQMPKIERIKKRHFLKKKEQKQILEQVEKNLGVVVCNLDEKAHLEEGVLDTGGKVLLLDGDILFFEDSGKLIPTLRAVLAGIVSIPQITVDMGAVKFVANGADVMRPGITKINENVRKDTVVAIVDERHGKPLAVGIALMDAAEMRAATSGKVVLSRHYVGDSLWEFSKS